MRISWLFTIVLLLISTIFAQNSDQTDSIGFDCTILHPENAESSELTVSSDTVKFRLFYVDNVCSGFFYRFLRESNTLFVKRTSSPLDTCTSDEQILYGVEGHIINVPKGKYIFELQTGPSDSIQESIFREVVIIKK